MQDLGKHIFPETKIIGISIRTTNQNGFAQMEIPEMWEYFFGENIGDAIPNKISDNIFCIYTEYENGADGLYTTILGKPVSSLEVIPEGMRGITIPGGSFQVFSSVGKADQSAMANWQHIWGAEIPRAFTFDFDFYEAGIFTKDTGEVKTFVAL